MKLICSVLKFIQNSTSWCPPAFYLGSLLFTLYTSLLSHVISRFNVTHHLYTDDIQIYLALDSRNFNSSICGANSVSKFISGVHGWCQIKT